MIDSQTAWAHVHKNAIKASKTGMVWHSLVEGASYTISEIHNDKIIIARLDGGNLQVLSNTKVIKASIDFNKSRCIMPRRHLINPTVAEETAFVLFHPQLGWNETNTHIIQISY